MLSAPQSIDDWGLTDQSLGLDVARPASFLVDVRGKVVWRYLPDDWRQRLSPEEYLAAFEAAVAGGGVEGEDP